ncbi:polycystin-1-like protein 2 [Genypterus blacodes]|uniref:polycystin-1-like protein 2 n=1 Tax=Genypterus blacodes TaxID=154954 RepID=UPI003F771530
MLQRPAGGLVNSSILYLGNYSTMILDVPTVDTTLVLRMEPSVDLLPFKLYLGYQQYPTHTDYVAMTQMPHKGTTQEERYTWLLNSDLLRGRTGVHYLLVRPIVGPGIKSINATLTITSIATGCKFWDDEKNNWSTYGCKVGVYTTPAVTHCRCTHLTAFGSSFFVTPNLVDPSRSAELFSTFADNPVVVCFVGALFLAYLLVAIWARRKDIQDTAKVKVTVLEDNHPMDEYCYLLCIGTGHRRGASTSSEVIITLQGAEGNSEPHHLSDPMRCVFERGGVDMFLLTTTFPLGDMQGIRLWHNNSGGNPDWFVSNVMVQDLQTKQKWHFLCNSWLAVGVWDCCLDNFFPVASETDMKKFRNLFFMKTTKDFSDGHLWFSVISRPARSSFSRLQRVSCCFSLLLCTMLTSVMFYGIPTDPKDQTLDMGPFEFTLQQFLIGIQSSLIMFPVNLLIVGIFRYARPHEIICCKRKAKRRDSTEHESYSRLFLPQTYTDVKEITLKSVFKDISDIAVSLSKSQKSIKPSTESDFGLGEQVDINAALSVVEDFIRQNKSIDYDDATAQLHLPGMILCRTWEFADVESGNQLNCNGTQHLHRKLCHIEKKLKLLGASGFHSRHNYSQAKKQVQSMKALLQDQALKSSQGFQDEVNEANTDGGSSGKNSSCFQRGLPWWFVFVGWLLVLATSCVAGYFTMLYGLKFGKERSISWLVSMVISFFQSLLVIQPLKVICLAVFFALVLKKVEEEDFQNMIFVRHRRNPDAYRVKAKDSRLYEPPPPGDIKKMRQNKIKEERAYVLLKEILIYIGFMWMLLLVAYGQRDPNAFFLTRHIRQSFSKGISQSMSEGDVFAWANNTLLNNLFGTYPGFITDGNSKLLAKARLRQVRVQKNSCQISDWMQQLVSECNALYSWEEEDTASYDPGWIHPVGDNISVSQPTPWIYQTQAQLRAHPIWGKLDLYRGGGFAVELGPDLQNASRTLQYLFNNTWLDMYTRAVFVEFTVYNANVNLFCIVTLLLETAAVGSFVFRSELQSVRLYQSTGGLHAFVMAGEIIYFLFILYYMYLQAKLMKQQKCGYFKNKWNLLDLAIILLSWSALIVFITRAVLGNRDMTYYQNHKDQFPSFYETASADLVLQYLIAFVVLLATVKLWHLLRLNPKMNLLTATLQRAWHDISGFLMIIVIMLLAYSITCNLLYGWKLSSYKTLLDSILTIISLQMGIFNYSEVMNHNIVLGAIIVGSCIVFMTFVVLNLLISVILTAFNMEQIYHKPSEEEEIVDLIVMKLLSLFGIRSKETEDPQEQNGSTDTACNDGKIDTFDK